MFLNMVNIGESGLRIRNCQLRIRTIAKYLASQSELDFLHVFRNFEKNSQFRNFSEFLAE